MKKIACFDLDGVSMREHDPFSVRLIQTQGEDITPAVNEFFTNEFGAVMVGRRGLAESIEPYLERFHWEGGVKSLLDFWFEGEKDTDQSVLEIIKNVRQKGIPTYLVTDNPRERVLAYWGNFLGAHFVGRYVSGETGLKKNSAALWDVIADDTGTTKADIFFVDDDQENVDVAVSAGVSAVFFSSADDLTQQLDNFLLR